VRRLVLIVLVAVSAVAVALVVSDRDGDGRRRAGRASTLGSSSSTSSSTTTTTRPRRGSGQPVTIAFGGDTHFEGNLRYLLNTNPGGMFAPIAPTLSGADVAMVNLETAIATGGSPDPKNYNFRAPPSAFEALRAAGVDVVTMANNHGRDYGPEGLAETLAAKAQTPLVVLGLGADATEAYKPWLTTVKGQRLAFFAATDVLDDWLIDAWTATDTQAGLASTKGAAVDRLVAGISAARPQADTIVVDLHWGVEGSNCPSPRQQELAKQLVDAGADIVVGSHSHRVETAGRLDGALVDYGLGNFAFYNESGPSGVTGVLRVTATGRDIDTYEWLPARISGGIPHLLSGSAAAADNAAFASRRACSGLAP
jgi:poly-gamma-glutamate capsule biosynthesis protein CapA/YwtB (metallophosphatase superfamily)